MKSKKKYSLQEKVRVFFIFYCFFNVNSIFADASRYESTAFVEEEPPVFLVQRMIESGTNYAPPTRQVPQTRAARPGEAPQNHGIRSPRRVPARGQSPRILYKREPLLLWGGGLAVFTQGSLTNYINSPMLGLHLGLKKNYAQGWGAFIYPVLLFDLVTSQKTAETAGKDGYDRPNTATFNMANLYLMGGHDFILIPRSLTFFVEFGPMLTQRSLVVSDSSDMPQGTQVITNIGLAANLGFQYTFLQTAQNRFFLRSSLNVSQAMPAKKPVTRSFVEQESVDVSSLMLSAALSAGLEI